MCNLDYENKTVVFRYITEILQSKKLLQAQCVSVVTATVDFQYLDEI